MTAPLDPDARSVRVAVPGESELVARGLASLLRRHSRRLRLAGTCPRACRAADVVLFDSRLLDRDQRAELMELIMSRGVRFAEFSWRVDPELVQRARERGASGYVYKGLDARTLVQALECIAAGQWSAPAVAAPSLPREHPVSIAQREFGLSSRESEMLVHIARGLSNDAIAASCFLSVNSVKTYIRTGYRKIGVTRRAQAVLWAVDHGLVDLSVDEAAPVAATS